MTSAEIDYFLNTPSSKVSYRPSLFVYFSQAIITYKNEIIGFILTSTTVIKKTSVPSILKTFYNRCKSNIVDTFQNIIITIKSRFSMITHL